MVTAAWKTTTGPRLLVSLHVCVFVSIFPQRNKTAGCCSLHRGGVRSLLLTALFFSKGACLQITNKSLSSSSIKNHCLHAPYSLRYLPAASSSTQTPPHDCINLGLSQVSYLFSLALLYSFTLHFLSPSLLGFICFIYLSSAFEFPHPELCHRQVQSR